MFKKVLYPTDFSECSESVIPFIKKLKKSGTGEVVILHVVDMRYGGLIESDSSYGEMTIHPIELDFYNMMIEESKKKIEKVRKKFGGEFRVKTIVEEGVPFKTIIEYAEKEKVSLIAIGSHGRSNIQEMLLGSVSEKVIRKSKKPCLVIKR